MFYAGHTRCPKPSDYDALPYRQDYRDYVEGQRYRCRARPGYMFTYRGRDGDHPLYLRSYLATVNGVLPNDQWDVRSWPVEGS